MRGADVEASGTGFSATHAPLTAREKWINLLKTSLVLLALLNISLLPFDLRFLKLFQLIEEPVDIAICVTAFFNLLVNSQPFGRHMTKKAGWLFLTPTFLLLFMSAWYDWFVRFPPSRAEGNDSAWPMWSPQYWVRPGNITGGMVQAAMLTGFCNSYAVALLLSGKCAMLKVAKPWAVRTRTRRIILIASGIWGEFYFRKMSLDIPLTFDSPTLFDEDKLPWWEVLRQSWIEFGNPFAPHPGVDWGMLMLFNFLVGFGLNALFFRMRGGGVFYTLDCNTWKFSSTVEPILPAVLKTEPHAVRYLRATADQLHDEDTAPEKEGGVKDEQSAMAPQQYMGLEPLMRGYSSSGIYGPINITVAGGLIILFARGIYAAPYFFGWTTLA